MCTGSHPFIAVPNTVQLVAVFQANGQPTENVYNIKVAHPVTASDLVAIEGFFAGWWSNHGRHLTTSACELSECRLKDLSAENSFGYDAGHTNLGGDHIGEAMPNNLAIVAKWGTGLTGRSFSGRQYIVGVASDQFTQNKLTSDAQAAYATTYIRLINGMEFDAAYKLAVVSICAANVWRTVGISTPIISLTLERNLRTQRRRMEEN